MSEVSIIHDFEEFRQEVARLQQIIMEEKEKQLTEYRQLGIDPPAMISFESLDLHLYRKDMLRIHKTLQWRKHNARLSKVDRKAARFVAIAGICEMIKEEYIGRFWDLYERIIGWRGDSTVYNWIWAVGFREAGIELIQGDRREFVQTLVMESGIPRSRTSDIISFFEIFWRYLRDRDVLQVIDDLQDESDRFNHIPLSERVRLRSFASSASEYSRAFALAVIRLLKIFTYIEDSSIIAGGEISDWSDQIFRETGVNPRTVLRGKQQLDSLYSRLLGMVTPEKLRGILSSKPPGTKIIVPDGTTTRSDQYEGIQFGQYMIDGSLFTCVPGTGIDLDYLINCPLDEIIKFSDAFLLRSKTGISVTINGVARNDSVKEIWVSRKPYGNIFYYKAKAADLIHLSTSSKTMDKSLSGSEGLVCYPYLYYTGKVQNNEHFLSVRVNFIRFYCPAFSKRDIS